MWSEFAVACVACSVMLCAPGYFVFRAFLMRRLTALAAAPCFSVAAFAIMAIIYYPLGIACTPLSMIIPLLCLALLVFAARFVYSLIRSRIHLLKKCDDNRQWMVFAVYLVVGILAVIFLYLSTLQSPQSFSQEFDNLFHLSLVQHFSESGQWSSLAASIYDDPLNPACNPTPNLAMYPSAWHAICALIAQLFSQTAAFAVNVANSVFMGIVFPSGMYLLIRTLFPNSIRIQCAGAFATVAFASFPWRLLWWGPIYPNMASDCLIPIILALFILMCERDTLRAERVLYAFAILFGGMSLVLLQPSAVFALAVFLAPYISWRIYSESLRKWPHQSGASIIQRFFSLPVLFGALFIVFAVFVWLGIYALLSGSDVLGFTWESLMRVDEGILNVLFLNYCYTPWAPALALLVILGCAYSLWKGKNRWLVASYFIICSMLIVTLSIDGELKHIVAGFWYTDQMRLAALAAIFAMPLAALGTDALLKFASFAIMKLPLPLDRAIIVDIVSSVAISLLLLVATFSPYDFGNSDKDKPYETALGNIRNTIKWTYNKHPLWYYTNEEELFVCRVLDEYPDEQFLNNPFDGSCWAYGANGMNVFYRAFDVYDYKLESEQSKIIRTRLCNAASDNEVQDALRVVNARYVIQLDAFGKAYDAMYQWMYYIGQWTGFNEITEDTPGFELVMSQGDMRLYRITCIEDTQDCTE